MNNLFFTIGRFSTEKYAEATVHRFKRVIDGKYKTVNPVLHAIHKPGRISLAEVCEILGLTWVEQDRHLYWDSMDEWTVALKRGEKRHWVTPWWVIRAPMWKIDDDILVTFEMDTRNYIAK